MKKKSRDIEVCALSLQWPAERPKNAGWPVRKHRAKRNGPNDLYPLLDLFCSSDRVVVGALFGDSVQAQNSFQCFVSNIS